jgi:hypothetical protein
MKLKRSLQVCFQSKNSGDKRTPTTYDPNLRFINLVVAQKVNLYFMKQHRRDRPNLPLEYSKAGTAVTLAP